MSEFVLIGAGGHASVLAGIVRRDGLGTVLGYVDRRPGESRFGLPCLGTDDDPPVELDRVRLLFGIGLIANAGPRWMLFEDYRRNGRRFHTLISAQAAVADDATAGEGSVVLDQTVVGFGARLGKAVIVNNGAVIEHGCRIGDGTHVAPNATVCGDATIGDRCLIGAGSVIVQGVHVASDVTIGAGAVVVGDVHAPGCYVGAPARPRTEAGS